jgi:hypothetical protein
LLPKATTFPFFHSASFRFLIKKNNTCKEVIVSGNIPSAIRDNQGRGKVGDFLKNCLKDGSTLSFVSAYFTIYAYEKLEDHLHKIEHLNFLFCEPRFVKNLDSDRINK